MPKDAYVVSRIFPRATAYINQRTTNKQNGMCAQRRHRAALTSAQSLLCAQWVSKDPSVLYVYIEGSEQTVQADLCPRLAIL